MKNIEFRSNRAAAVVAGGMVTAAATLFFLLLFWNRFAGLRSGDGGFTGGVFFLNGFLPYRDYFNPGPPLFLLRTAAVLALFGKHVTALRGAAIVERILLSLCLYSWLARFFKARNAALAAIVTIVVSTGDLSDPLSSYNHFAVLLGVISGLVASYALDEKRSSRSLVFLGGSSGVFAFLCLACKQTVGLGVSVAVPVIVGACLLRWEGVRKAALYCFGFVAGWVLFMALLFAWLARLGVWQSFLQQIFVTGPAAKASHPGDFLARTIFVARSAWWAPLIGAVMLLLCWGALRRASTSEREADGADPASMLKIFGVLALSIGVIGLSSVVLAQLTSNNIITNTAYLLARFGNDSLKPFVYLAFVGSGALAILFAWEYLRGSLSRRQSQMLLFASVSFAIALMLSLSYPVLMVMMVPGLGLFLAASLEEFSYWPGWLAIGVCAMLLFGETQAKLLDPFEFAAWIEPPATMANAVSSLPELRGLVLPEDTVQFIDGTVRIIQENSSPNDTIFVYPELSYFYGLTNRKPATFSGSHNIDVVSDALAREEAARLLRTRPAVLIYGPHSEGFLRSDEIMWRNGQPSGQRELIAAVQMLTYQYELAAEFHLYPGGHPVYVYVRPQSERATASGLAAGAR